MSKITNDQIVKGALELSEIYTQISKECTYESGESLFNISVGLSGRGSIVEMNIGNKRFLDLIAQYPCCGEFSRVEVTKLDKSYHISYRLPCYDNKVTAITIAHSIETVILLLGQDIMDNIQIIT